ncbi:MAG: lysophospholipid acyltransferase family protein [Halothiobacillus sp.]
MSKRTAQSHGRPLRSALRLMMIRFFLRACTSLPLPLSHAIGTGLGRLAWLTRSPLRRTAEANIARCLPELNPAEQQQLVKDSLVQTGQTLTELGRVWRAKRRQIEALVQGVEGQHYLDQALATGRGVILLAPHSGAWELGGLFMSLSTPMTTLYRPPREPAFERLMTQARARFGSKLVPANRFGVKALLLALRRGELITILPDQEPNVGEGAFAPFFGHPAYTLTLVHNLMLKTGAVAVLGRTERLAHGAGYRLHFYPAPAELANPDPAIALAALNAGVEHLVRLAPAQYQWGYRRFRRQPAPVPPQA